MLMYLLSISASAAAEVADVTEAKTITATINDAKFMLNGTIEVILKDKTSKKQLTALSYENRVYVPVEAIAELINLPVTYNESTNTYEIGKKSGLGDNLVDIKETSSNDIKHFVKTIDMDILTINEGNKNEQAFKSGLALLTPGKNKTYSRTFSLDAKYTELNFFSIIDSKTTNDENLIITFVDTDKKRIIKTAYIYFTARSYGKLYLLNSSRLYGLNSSTGIISCIIVCKKYRVIPRPLNATIRNTRYTAKTPKHEIATILGIFLSKEISRLFLVKKE